MLDSSLSTFSEEFRPRQIYTDGHSARTVVITTARGLENKEAVRAAQNLGVRVMKCARGGWKGFTTGFPENGDRTGANRGLLRRRACGCSGITGANEIDYLFHYLSPREFNSPEAMNGPDLQSLVVRESLRVDFGDDHLIHGYL